jgi:hypothetical protein
MAKSKNDQRVPNGLNDHGKLKGAWNLRNDVLVTCLDALKDD